MGMLSFLMCGKICWFSGRKPKNYISTVRLLSLQQTNAILEDTQRAVIWLGSSEGLYKLNLSKPKYKIEKSSFPYQTINDLLIDVKGDLWISTNRGLIKYDPDSNVTRNFSTLDGLQAQEFNFWSAIKTSNGEMVFGGINGVNIFVPEEILSLNIDARPVITGIQVNDKDTTGLQCEKTGAKNIAKIKKLSFEYAQNTLYFFFASREYSAPDLNLFSYKLSGIDSDWTPSFKRQILPDMQISL